MVSVANLLIGRGLKLEPTECRGQKYVGIEYRCQRWIMHKVQESCVCVVHSTVVRCMLCADCRNQEWVVQGSNVCNVHNEGVRSIYNPGEQHPLWFILPINYWLSHTETINNLLLHGHGYLSLQPLLLARKCWGGGAEDGQHDILIPV